jgi:hypothetical protein
MTRDDIYRQALVELRNDHARIAVAIDGIEQLLKAVEAPSASINGRRAPRALRGRRAAGDATPPPLDVTGIRRSADAPASTAAPSADPEEAFVGLYDQRIVARLRLAPDTGATLTEVARGVVGQHAMKQKAGSIFGALASLVKRGVVRKDGRYYRLPPQAEED